VSGEGGRVLVKKEQRRKTRLETTRAEGEKKYNRQRRETKKKRRELLFARGGGGDLRFRLKGTRHGVTRYDLMASEKRGLPPKKGGPVKKNLLVKQYQHHVVDVGSSYPERRGKGKGPVFQMGGQSKKSAEFACV